MNRNIIITLVLIGVLLMGLSTPVMAQLWMPTLPVYPYEPTECDSVEVGIYISGCIMSVTPAVTDHTVTVTVVDNDICNTPVPAGPRMIQLGKLAPGAYQLSFIRHDTLMTGEGGEPYLKSFTVASADCTDVQPPDVLPTLTPQHGANISSPFPGVITVSGITIPGVEGTFWGSFQWNPKRLSLKLIAHGQDPQHSY